MNLHKADEKLAFNRVADMVFVWERDNRPKFTNFLPNSQAQGIINILKKEHGSIFSAFGGIEDAGRVQIGISQNPIEHDMFPIEPIEIVFGTETKKINHRSVLGSILGLGIDRSLVGDILVFSQKSVVFLDTRMAAGFVLDNLTHVGKSKVKLQKADKDTFFVPLENYKKLAITLDNIRVSSIVAKGFGISRQTAVKLLNAKKITINWAIQTKDNAQIKQKDTISVRGRGKIVVAQVCGGDIDIHVYK